MKPFHRLASCSILLIGMAACDAGDDGGADQDSLLDFQPSSCVHDTTGSSALRAGLGAGGLDGGDTLDGGVEVPGGDDCVAWRKTSAGVLEVEAFGFNPGCRDELLSEIPWRPSVQKPAAGEVTLSVVWPSDQVPACAGHCSYNFAFEVELEHPDEPLAVTVEVRGCLSCDADTRHVTVPAGHEGQRQVVCDAK